jgi:hypothetical protein
MPILEMRTAQQTSTKESDEEVAELPSGIERFRSDGVAPAAFDRPLIDSHGVEAFDRLLETALRMPILTLGEAARGERARKIVQRGAQERQIKNQAYGCHVGGRCAP